MHLAKLAKNLSALRTLGIPRSAFFKSHALPHAGNRSQHTNFQSCLSHRSHIYNEYYQWIPQRDGYFFCDFPSEDLAHYRSGGYHPVHLGDTMKGGRYQIVQKLGWGRDATVWLAEDRRVPRQVAIKVVRSSRRHDGEEAGALRRLTETPTSHSGKNHVIQLLDLFELKGPNGRHLCLVTEAVGPGIRVNELSPKAAWEIARQIVEATAYFHDLGIVHGDLYHEKIRFSNTNLLHPNGDPLTTLGKPETSNVQSVDNLDNVKSILGQESTARLPRYLVESLWEYPESVSYDAVRDSGVKIIGFGEPLLNRMKSGANSAFHYQAPELVLSAQLDARADIWSLGCMIYQLVNIEALIWIWCDTKDDIVDEWIKAFGELPEEWKRHCPPRTNESPDPGEYNIRKGLNTDYPTLDPGTELFSKDNLDVLGDLLISMTQYRPSDRPSASQVLQHPWFQRCPSLRTFKLPTEE